MCVCVRARTRVHVCVRPVNLRVSQGLELQLNAEFLAPDSETQLTGFKTQSLFEEKGLDSVWLSCKVLT